MAHCGVDAAWPLLWRFLLRFVNKSFKYLNGQQGFLWFWYLYNVLKGILRKKIGFRNFNAQRSNFKVPASATPSDCGWPWVSAKKESGFLNWPWRQVRNCQILLVQVAVVSVVVRSFRRQKANKPKLLKQGGCQSSKIKSWGFEMFLRWRHSSPIFHYAVNFIGCHFVKKGALLRSSLSITEYGSCFPFTNYS